MLKKKKKLKTEKTHFHNVKTGYQWAFKNKATHWKPEKKVFRLEIVCATHPCISITFLAHNTL